MNSPARVDATAAVDVIDGPQITGRSWSAAEAYSYCERLARSHYENFPVGSFFIPKRLRKHFYSIYAFARSADDFADENYGGDAGQNELERLKYLKRWGELLLDCYEGRATHPIFIALAKTAAEFDLPVSLFEDLLSAFTQDVTTRRYHGFSELLDYCRRSANPVGRLILLLFGYRENELHLYSDAICTALQLTNHWQDVRIDLFKDRVYLPAEDLAACGLSVEDLRREQAGEAFRRVMKLEIQRTRECFAQGRPLCYSTPGRLGLELRAIWHAGSLILDRIEENGYDVFSGRPAIRGFDKVRIVILAFRKSHFLDQ